MRSFWIKITKKFSMCEVSYMDHHLMVYTRNYEVVIDTKPTYSKIRFSINPYTNEREFIENLSYDELVELLESALKEAIHKAMVHEEYAKMFN